MMMIWPRKTARWMSAAVCLLLSTVVVVPDVHATAVVTNTMDSYTFDHYVQEFGKVYATEQERLMRRDIFASNLEEIRRHNQYLKEGGNGGPVWGVNEWTDRKIPEELPLGLQKKSLVLAASDNHGSPLMNLYTKKSTAAQDFYQHWLEHEVVPVSELPAQVDWRTHQNPPIITDVKQQGFCGSCWAFASAAVLESHIALRTGQLFTLSPQELVSCVDNPLHCGGAGGCEGATYELAFDYAVQHGMVPEEEFPYKSGSGRRVKCSLVNDNKRENATTTTSNNNVLLRGTNIRNDKIDNKVDGGDDDNFIHGAVATIDGFINFPTNNYTILMNAVASLGPIGVTVAATKWAFYMGGVYSSKNHHSADATDVNHAVVLEGYGIDQETQKPFWLVRNSWGSSWGEGGYIRLERVDPSTLPDFDEDDCGMDTTPADGAACTKDKDGNDIVPEPVKVCGTSAILYDTFAPIGGRLIQTSTNSQKTSVEIE